MPIDCFHPAFSAGARAYAELSYDETAMHIRLTSHEPSPVANAKEDGGKVFEDNCLEVFLRPEDDTHYLNIETNSLGYSLIGYRTDRKNKTDITHYKNDFNIKAGIDSENGLWYVEMSIPFASLEQLYGRKLTKRYRMNFYSCAESVPSPYFGMWNDTEAQQPDFHRPDMFGLVELDD